MPPVLVIFAVLGAFLYRFDMANVSFGFFRVDFHAPCFKKFVKYFLDISLQSLEDEAPA